MFWVFRVSVETKQVDDIYSRLVFIFINLEAALVISNKLNNIFSINLQVFNLLGIYVL